MFLVKIRFLRVSGETDLIDDDLTTFGYKRGRDLAFKEDRLIRAFQDTRAAVDACGRINIVRGELILRVAGVDAFNWTYGHAGVIRKADMDDIKASSVHML